MKLSLLKIHVAVLLFGVAGLFAKWLTVHPIILVFGRVFFASIALYLILQITKQNLSLKNKRDYFFLAILGGLLAFHWVSFFHSIQLSSIAIGLLTYSSFPLFVTILEPILFKERFKARSILSAILAILGILIIVPEFSFDNTTFKAIVWGVLSAFSFALLSLANRSYVKKHTALKIAFYEDAAATIFLLPFLFFLTFTFSFKLVSMLLLLGVVFTAVSHTLFIDGLKKVKAQTASIVASLEPVYGIVLGIVFFVEIPDLRTIIGGFVIISAVVYNSISIKKSSNKNTL
ncbi:MAG: EamA family transporter [Bacteroidetes bacterium]|nr:EamA family transporter [Bacteroidota bacterium]MBT4967942.1 EamA family transporter [Bacteroidota bacterium]